MRGDLVANKTPQKPSAKKPGKSLKEKRAAKKSKAQDRSTLPK